MNTYIAFGPFTLKRFQLEINNFKFFIYSSASALNHFSTEIFQIETIQMTRNLTLSAFRNFSINRQLALVTFFKSRRKAEIA